MDRLQTHKCFLSVGVSTAGWPQDLEKISVRISKVEAPFGEVFRHLHRMSGEKVFKICDADKPAELIDFRQNAYVL